MSFFAPQVPQKSEDSKSWNVVLVWVQQNWKGWDRMICPLEWTSYVDITSSNTSLSVPPSMVISGVGCQKAAGTEEDQRMCWKQREAQYLGRVEYSKRLVLKLIRVDDFGEPCGWLGDQWKQSEMRTDMKQDSGRCGIKCTVPPPPYLHHYVFFDASFVIFHYANLSMPVAAC